MTMTYVVTCQGCSAAPAEFHVWVFASRDALPETRELCTSCRDAAREVSHAVSWKRLGEDEPDAEERQR